jgi:hypothetical protein
LHQAWPKSIQVLNQYGWNALHSLCAHIRSSSSSSSSSSMLFDNNGITLQENYTRIAQYLVQQELSAVQVATYHYQDLPLHMACERSAPLAIIQCLVQADNRVDHGEISVSVQTRNAFGQLPLHKACAAMRLSLDTIQYLVELWPAGAMMKDVNGETPLDVLRRTKSHEIKEWLDHNNMKRSRPAEQQDALLQQEADGRDKCNGCYPWWQECPPSNFPAHHRLSLSSSGSTTATAKKLLAAALKHDGRAVALVAENVGHATNLACEFARDWQEGPSSLSSSPPGSRFCVWLNAANEESLRQGYLSAIANITRSSSHVCGLPSDDSSSTSSSSKRARRDRLDSSLHALADELMCVLWHLPRHLQWMVVFANALFE